MWYFLFWFACADYFDIHGVQFNDESRTRLEKAPDDLIEYEIPQETETIAGGNLKSYSAFASCRIKLSKLKFQNGSKLKTIEQYGLYGLSALTELDMSMCTMFTEFTDACLADCISLVTLKLPPNLQYVKNGGLKNLRSLKRLDFPSSFLEIGGYSSIFSSTMDGCYSLEFITWGDNPSIKSIGQLGLAGCNISTLHIPLSLTYIGQESLSGAPIIEFIVDQGHKSFYAEGMWLYDSAAKTKLILVSNKQSGVVTIPDSVEIISKGALINCPVTGINFGTKIKRLEADSLMYTKISEITIPETVTFVGTRALFKCTKLRELNINAKITIISDSLLNGCINLQRIVVPKGVTEILYSAFASCTSVDYIFIPNSVSKIGSGVFRDINKTAIIEFEDGSPLKIQDGYIYNSDYTSLIMCILFENEFTATIKKSVETIDTDCFNGLGVIKVIFEDDSRLVNINTNAFYNSKLTSISLPPSVRYIMDSAFYNCPLKSVSFNSGLVGISKNAFYQAQITKAVFPDSLETIGESAFNSCSMLTNIIFGSGIRSIGIKAFAGTKIKSVEIPPNASDIGDSAFANSNLVDLIFTSPSYIETISMYAFKDCNFLTDIKFAPEIKEIGEGCFHGCSLLPNVEIGEGVVNISSQAFADCTSLTTVKIPDTSSLKSIGSLAFDGCWSLKEFDISPYNPSFSTNEGVLFDRERTQIILYLSANEQQHFIVPETVTEILIYAFQKATNLVSVDIAGNITKIGYRAFHGCSNLEYINIPSSLEEIGSMAFSECPSIHCGSIIHDSEKRGWLESWGVPAEGLEPCATSLFTLGTKEGGFNLFSLVLNSIEDNEDAVI